MNPDCPMFLRNRHVGWSVKKRVGLEHTKKIRAEKMYSARIFLYDDLGKTVISRIPCDLQ